MGVVGSVSEQLIRSAILIPIFWADGDWQILLTRRSDQLPTHAGQVSFPGGKCLANEASRMAALRETDEELGITPESVRVVGCLPYYQTFSGFFVTPWLGWLQQVPSIQHDPNEVAEVFTLPWRDLQQATIQHHQQQQVEYWSLSYQAQYIWGMTGSLLKYLRDYYALEQLNP